MNQTLTTPETADAARLLASLMQGSSVGSDIRELRAEISGFMATIREVLTASRQDEDRWLDARAAREYLGGMSESTFDKYRYTTKTRIKGYLVGGKTLYKKSELDRFVILYAVSEAA